ncbi:MAG: TOTE conflict system archaeo-eukaryotic primase domain-containing protein [Bacteriovoracia bacterium]
MHLEINALRNHHIKGKKSEALPVILGRVSLATIPQSPQDKIDLFLKLFRCREDVYPKRWENSKTGKQGYSPVCDLEWVKPICQKPTIRCSDCQHQKFPPLDSFAVESHLKGHTTIGTYAIRADDTCSFLACDFDESSWKEDVLAYKQAARELGIEVYIERSRSGKGGHAWIFFEDFVHARLARSLGTLILAKCSELNIRLSLDSYDRFFPSQDYLPKGGFGNLIALPLQKTSRDLGNSCFLDSEFNPVQDQWDHLAKARRISKMELQTLLDNNLPRVRRVESTDAFDDISWSTDQAILDKTTLEKIDYYLEGRTVEVSFGSMISVPLENLAGRIVAKLRKTASFPNPEFYKLQRMRMQTYPHPRFIFSGTITHSEIILPRGVLDEVVKILTLAGAKVVIRDERIAKRKIKVSFYGELTPEQSEAIKTWKAQDTGILMAPPGAGKTVMACAVIAERKVSTLILVHRAQLMDQWKERISQFLEIPVKEIGTLGGAKKKLTGNIDVGMLQSLAKVEDLSEISQKYSQIIIDECHHIPAVSFEDILKQLPARYVLGLTATPYRKDGLEKILFQQCGPIRYEMKLSDRANLIKIVHFHETGFKVPEELAQKAPYHLLIQHLVTDFKRNQLIASLAVNAINKKRIPILISDRKDHLDLLSNLIASKLPELKIVQLDGDLTGKKRKHALIEIEQSIKAKERILLLATSSLIGEGFDLPELDTLILASPLSFEGRIVQYAGRLHRASDGKSDVQIIDFIDSFSAIFSKMYRNRLKAYRKMGYSVNLQGSLI